jgi:hypothetical protein
MCVTSGVAHAQIANTIQLTASPESLPANGYSRSVISANVRDDHNRPVPDGTEVRFSTTLGSIDPVARTEAGQARVNLTSAAAPGIASVIVTAGRANREMRVLFLSQGQRGPERPNVIPVEGEYVGYSADHGVIDAIGRVTVRIGKVTILADHVQLNAMTTKLVAEATGSSLGMTVTDGKTTWIAHRLTYDGATLEGLVEQDSGTYQYVGPPLILGKAVTDVAPDAFAMEDLDDTNMWITAKRAALFPGQRIHFRGAQLRPAGKKVLTLPYHTLPLTSSGTETNQIIGVGTQGLTLDLPYYLKLTDHSSTSLHLGLNQIQGSYGAISPGLGLDLRHRLFIGEHGEETINLTRFTSSDWGAWYKHARTWSPALQTTAYVEYPDHRDLFATGSAYWQGKNLTGALNLSSTRVSGFDPSYVSDVSFETRPVALSQTGWKYSFISQTGLSTGSALHEFRQALLVRASLPSWRWSKRTFSTATVTAGRILAARKPGNSADAVYSVNHRFGAQTLIGLNYSYFDRPGLSSLTSKHRLGAQVIAGTKRASFYSTISHTLDGRSTSMVNDVTYQVLPAGPLSLGFRNTYFSYLGLPYSDQEYSVSYPVLKRPFTLYWSQKRHHFQIEFAQIGF